MKRLISLIVASLMIMPVVAQSDTRIQRQKQRESQARIKQLTRAGWEVIGGKETIEGAVQSHFDKLIKGGDDIIEIYGTANRVKTTDEGIAKATNNAGATYARQQSSDLKGRITSNVASAPAPSEIEGLIKAYETNLKDGVKSIMTPSYKLMRTGADGSMEVEVYFILSEKAASEVRTRAMESLIDNNQYAKAHSAAIKEYVKAGFKN